MRFDIGLRKVPPFGALTVVKHVRDRLECNFVLFISSISRRVLLDTVNRFHLFKF